MTTTFIILSLSCLGGILRLLVMTRSNVQYAEQWQRYHQTGEPVPPTPRLQRHVLAQVVKYIFTVSIVTTLILYPAHAYACSGILDCAFGWTERTQVRAERDIEQERIKSQAQQEITRIQGEADAHIKQAEAEVERVRQMQFQSEAQRDIAIAQAQAQAEEYKAMIAGLTDEKLAGIQANADTQIVALQEQARIAVAGITETGQTERYRIVSGWATVIVSIIVAALVGLYWMRRSTGRVMMVLPRPHAPRPALGERGQLPWYSDSVEIVEVKHNVITRR